MHAPSIHGTAGRQQHHQRRQQRRQQHHQTRSGSSLGTDSRNACRYSCKHPPVAGYISNDIGRQAAKARALWSVGHRSNNHPSKTGAIHMTSLGHAHKQHTGQAGNDIIRHTIIIQRGAIVEKGNVIMFECKFPSRRQRIPVNSSKRCVVVFDFQRSHFKAKAKKGRGKCDGSAKCAKVVVSKGANR